MKHFDMIVFEPKELSKSLDIGVAQLKANSQAVTGISIHPETYAVLCELNNVEHDINIVHNNIAIEQDRDVPPGTVIRFYHENEGEVEEIYKAPYWVDFIYPDTRIYNTVSDPRETTTKMCSISTFVRLKLSDGNYHLIKVSETTNVVPLLDGFNAQRVVSEVTQRFQESVYSLMVNPPLPNEKTLDPIQLSEAKRLKQIGK